MVFRFRMLLSLQMLLRFNMLLKVKMLFSFRMFLSFKMLLRFKMLLISVKMLFRFKMLLPRYKMLISQQAAAQNTQCTTQLVKLPTASFKPSSNTAHARLFSQVQLPLLKHILPGFSRRIRVFQETSINVLCHFSASTSSGSQSFIP